MDIDEDMAWTVCLEHMVCGNCQKSTFRRVDYWMIL